MAMYQVNRADSIHIQIAVVSIQHKQKAKILTSFLRQLRKNGRNPGTGDKVQNVLTEGCCEVTRSVTLLIILEAKSSPAMKRYHR